MANGDQDGEMPDLLLFVEGVNLYATIEDTDDLSTMRGASWALLNILDNLAKAAEEKNIATLEPVFAAASKGYFKVTCDLCPDMLEKQIGNLLKTSHNAFDEAGALLPFLTFSVAAIKASDAPGDYHKAIRLLRNRIYENQYQTLSVDLPDLLSPKDRAQVLNSQDASLPCTHDHIRPRQALAWRSVFEEKGKPETPQQDVPVSLSVWERKQFGRGGRRHKFYKEQSAIEKNETLGFADNFAEIIENPPAGLPDVIKNKMAVLYMDGNSFTKIREQLVKTDDDMTVFAQELVKIRKRMLARLVDLFKTKNPTRKFRLDKPKKTKLEAGKDRPLPMLRMETLLWGGDENTFVFPAWCVEDVLVCLANFLAQDENRQIEIKEKNGEGEEPACLSYGLGLVICNHKTPIRLVKQLARDIAESAKNRTKNEQSDPLKLKSYLEYMVLAGVDMPVRSLEAERKTLFGIKGEDDQACIFSLPLDEIEKTFELIRNIKGVGDDDSGLPRSKLSNYLLDAVQNGCLNSHFFARLKAEEKQQARGRQEAGTALLDKLFDNEKYHPPALSGPYGSDYYKTPALAWSQEMPLAPLLHISILRPYVGLFEKEERA